MPADFVAQSSLRTPEPRLHTALVPDGNGRWAAARGLARAAGHRAGVEAVRRTVRAAPSLGIGTLTIHALSADNWKRPRAEVLSILDLVAEFLAGEVASCRAEGVRVTVLGRRDRLPDDVRGAIDTAERETAAGAAFHLRLAVDYSSRDAILAAAAETILVAVAGGSAATRASVSAALSADDLAAAVAEYRRRERRFGGLPAANARAGARP